MDNFRKIEEDLLENSLNIDSYMKELKKHSRNEYEKLRKREQEKLANPENPSALPCYQNIDDFYTTAQGGP